MRTASSVGAVSGQAIALCMGTVVGAAIDGVDDFKNVNANTFAAIMDLTFSVINLGFGFPSDFATNDKPLYTYYAFSSIPAILSAASAAISQFASSSDFTKGFNTVLPFLDFGYGIFSQVTAVMAAFSSQDPDFIGKDHLTFCQNFFSNMTYICKIGLTFGQTSRTVVSVLDFVLPVTSAGLGIAASV